VDLGLAFFWAKGLIEAVRPSKGFGGDHFNSSGALVDSKVIYSVPNSLNSAQALVLGRCLNKNPATYLPHFQSGVPFEVDMPPKNFVVFLPKLPSGVDTNLVLNSLGQLKGVNKDLIKLVDGSVTELKFDRGSLESLLTFEKCVAFKE
jgi:hypothetical protein